MDNEVSQDQEVILSSESIASCALELIDEVGVDKFSMRLLGDRMGVSAMAFYRYFPNKDALLEAVQSICWGGIEIVPFPGELWSDYLCRGVRSFYRLWKKHPNVLYLSYAGPLKSRVDALYKFHSMQGVTDEAFGIIWTTVNAFLSGYGIMGIANSDLPKLLALGEQPWTNAMRHIYSDEHFETGLNVVIAGLYAVLPEDAKNWRTPDDFEA